MFSKSRVLVTLSCLFGLSGCFLESDGGEEATQVSYEQCSAPDANNQLFSYLQDWYYWEQDLPTSYDPESHGDLKQAMAGLKVAQDDFSFVLTAEEYADYQASVFFGYGFSHQVTDAQDGLRIRYVFDEGSAAQAGLRRGDTIVAVDGRSVSAILADVNAGNTTLNEVFGPNEDGYTIDVSFDKPDGTSFTRAFSKGEISANTVMATQVKEVTIGDDSKKVGYLVFDSFDNKSEDELNESFNFFAQENIDEMILDLRYNGGGLIRVARQLSTQMAGDTVEGEVFVEYNHNSKQQGQNQTLFFGLGAGIEKMNLDRVVVLTTRGSCSASELVINALSPFVEVVTVGDNTCGKPVGMYPSEICDYVVFAINFETVNANGVGGYFDGLPVDCPVAAAVTGDWGVETDPLLAEGLYYLQNDRCSDNANATAFSTGANGTSFKHVPDKPLDFSKGPRAAKNLL